MYCGERWAYRWVILGVRCRKPDVLTDVDIAKLDAKQPATLLPDATEVNKGSGSGPFAKVTDSVVTAPPLETRAQKTLWLAGVLLLPVCSSWFRGSIEDSDRKSTPNGSHVISLRTSGVRRELKESMIFRTMAVFPSVLRSKIPVSPPNKRKKQLGALAAARWSASSC